MKTDIRCPHCGKTIQLDNYKEEIQQESLLKIREKEKVISDLRIKLEDAKRVAEQSSMQLQGEVQELEIINILSDLYPFDDIIQSKKGANAADILQTVRYQNGVITGKIYYESKNTRQWSNGWIPKLKKDNLVAKADVLVLVSATLPKEIHRYGLIDGVWVTGFDYIKELSLVLRHGIIKIHALSATKDGKESKMGQLYKYLTSDDFKSTFESLLEGFQNIRDSHNSEKVKQMRLWKEREQNFDQILSSSIEFYGTLKGIAGSALSNIPMLELQSGN